MEQVTLNLCDVETGRELLPSQRKRELLPERRRTGGLAEGLFGGPV